MDNYKSEKSCIIYVSDYHFEMIGLLNIRKDLEQNKKVVILTENNLTKTAKKVISRINLKDEERRKIENIDWSNNINKISKKELEKGNMAVYIKGSESFIKNQNEKIENMLKENYKKDELKENSEPYNTRKISIIDCYNYTDIEGRAQEISSKYKNKLVTKID